MKILSIKEFKVSNFRRIRIDGKKSDRAIINTAIAFVLICFLNLVFGCSYYKYTTMTNSGADNFFEQMVNHLYPDKKYPRKYFPLENLYLKLCLEKNLYVYDGRGRWKLVSPRISGDTLYARIYQAPLVKDIETGKAAEERRSQRYHPSTEREIVNQIDLTVKSISIEQDSLAIITASDIKNCKIYKNDPAKTGGMVFATFGILATTATLIMLIVAAATSCPFIYVYDGHDWQFAGEIYGGAVYRPLERDDHLELPNVSDLQDSPYKVKIANLLREIQYIDLVDLIMVGHDSTVQVAMDKYGQVQTISRPVPPVSAIDSKGQNCLPAVKTRDSYLHNFDGEPDTLGFNPYLNSLDLEFRSNTAATSAKLIVRAKNSVWGDRVVRKLYDLFGNRYPKYVRNQDERTDQFQLKWMVDQGLMLGVYVKKSGIWEQADYFYMTGPFGFRDMVIPINTEGAWEQGTTGSGENYTLPVKLVSGYNFWELDYAAIDLTDNAATTQYTVSAGTAKDQDGRDVSAQIAGDDGDYLVQKETGDEAFLEFDLPSPGTPAYTLFLHSKGFYHQAGHAKGQPDIVFLNTFREPGRLSLWSWQLKTTRDQDIIVYEEIFAK
jgi:hypothetical protein